MPINRHIDDFRTGRPRAETEPAGTKGSLSIATQPIVVMTIPRLGPFRIPYAAAMAVATLSEAWSAGPEG